MNVPQASPILNHPWARPRFHSLSLPVYLGRLRCVARRTEENVGWLGGSYGLDWGSVILRIWQCYQTLTVVWWIWSHVLPILPYCFPSKIQPQKSLNRELCNKRCIDDAGVSSDIWWPLNHCWIVEVEKTWTFFSRSFLPFAWMTISKCEWLWQIERNHSISRSCDLRPLKPITASFRLLRRYLIFNSSETRHAWRGCFSLWVAGSWDFLLLFFFLLLVGLH